LWAIVGAMRDVGEFDPAIPDSGHPRGWVVVEMAERQHGIVAHCQLVELGLRSSSIHDWVVASLLDRM
jgi:hypothetical protein